MLKHPNLFLRSAYHIDLAAYWMIRLHSPGVKCLNTALEDSDTYNIQGEIEILSSNSLL